MKQILVPIDFSANASNALQYAAALAVQTQSKLTLVHVMPVRVAGVTEAPIVVLPSSGNQEEHASTLEALAKQLKTEHQVAIEVDSICTTGLFLDKLLHLIRSRNIDIVVMGTAGASNYLDKLIGTNTMSLMKNAPCPVLAVPAKFHFNGIQKVAYASDLNPHDDFFMRQLNAFALPFHPAITIVHVVKPGHPLTASVHKKLHSISTKFSEWQYGTTVVKADSITAGLLSFVQQNQIDVLALALHNRSLLEDLFHTSISRQVALQCTIPLLTLPDLNIRADKGKQETKAIAD